MTGYVDLNQNKRQDWVTPPEVREVIEAFKPVRLDVCTGAHNAMGAEQFYTLQTNGLAQSWACGGLAWCNFPWSRFESPEWISKACREGNLGAEVLLLGPSRSDTRWFRELWRSADAVCFWGSRMTFLDPDTLEPLRIWDKKAKKWVASGCPVPTLLAYWGFDVARFAAVFEPKGPVVQLRQSTWWSSRPSPEAPSRAP